MLLSSQSDLVDAVIYVRQDVIICAVKGKYVLCHQLTGICQDTMFTMLIYVTSKL